ncbi:ubiquitin fusion degradation protein 2 [Xylaria bambusicola]|uniref:ubiquitin fusion degradation protein 2 n=1 Tax=Xylaria bambusicola TaxID=326684 RepID=UPI0020087179|nr:ubiquitin fusion degradation protein 2 [Xylaria bambusicola]KAI0517319.1 ubiquitin fusion degradation protein 2 [Xylaria bambusicola]
MDPNEQPEPTLPPAEQMRQRRLAKLASLNPAPAPASPAPASESQTPNPASQSASHSSPSPSNQSQPIRIAPKSAPTSSSPQNPFSQLASKMAESDERASVDSGNTRSAKRPTTTVDADPSEALPTKKAHAAAAGESVEDWADRVLSDVFLVTLDEKRKTDLRGAELTYLPELKAELEQSGEPVKLTTSSIDAALLEAAKYWSKNKALLDYLLPCWKRVMRANRPARRPSPEREAVLHEAKRLCMSNCVFALTMPEYFGRDGNPSHDSLVPYLLRNHDNEDGVCLDFFTEAVSRINEDDTIAPVFTEALATISSQLAKMTMNDNYKPYINCLVNYSRFPPLLDALAQHPNFQVRPRQDATKEELALATETDTILGPFFRISPLQTEVTKTYFANPRTIDPGHVKSSQGALQMTLKAHQGDLIGIINAFVRASPTAKNSTLDWFAFSLNSNHKRRALQVKATEVASDGFMVNVTAVLDKLCEPFMDATFSKINKVDLDYLRRTPRVDMSDETKLNADQATSDAFYNNKVDGSSNFISEVFFLTLAAHHYGLGATNSKLKDLDKDIKYVEKVIKQMEEQLPKVQNDPFRSTVVKQHIQTAVNTVEKYIALKHAIQAVVLDEGMQTLSLQFMRYVAVWLLRTASKSDYKPGKQISLPLSADKPEAFSCLPEYALQDVVENFKFVFRFVPNILMSAVGDEIITLCITFLRSSEYIKNPYLKSSLVTLLFAGTWPMYHLSRGVLGDSLISSKFANEHLLHSLMKFYIECEHSGVSSAFYDKFNIRYEIFQVIKTIWPNNVYKEKLSRESRVNRQFFVQFVNLLLNDATYLLDEALTKLVKIHDYQKQLQNQGLSPEELEKVRTDLEQAEQQCQSWMQLVNDTMGMMKLFTETLRDSFTMPEIVVRLAGMLNYNLESLVGPKRGQLKVEDAKKYHFDPKTLLSDFIDVYLNLGPKPEFVKAVASDGRSYKPANFEAAARLLQTSLGKPPEMVVAWNDLRKRIADAKDELDQAELDLGDIPPEFEDPIMGDLMSDPVILPSRHIMDRSTIVQQLLSTPKDPFSNVQMTIDDVVPADDLRKQIEAWKAERIARAREKAKLGDSMDTSTG